MRDVVEEPRLRESIAPPDGWRRALRGARVGFDLRRMHASGIGRYARSTFAALQTEAPELAWTAVLQSESDIEWVRRVAPAAVSIVSPATPYSPAEMLRVPKLRQAVDIWHSPHPFQLDLGRRGTRLVLTLLDLIPVTHPATAYARRRRIAFREFVRLACHRAHALISISSHTRSVFAETLSVQPSRVTVTHLAADPGRFAVTPPAERVAEFRATHGLPRRVMLYVGMLEPHKNVRILVDALGLLRERYEPGEFGLAIVGSTTGASAGRFASLHHASFRQHLSDTGLTDSVYLLGGLTDDDLRLAYAAADVVVQPSLVEGFGLTLLEAMSSGVPVAASDIPVFHEVAADSVAWFDPSSARSVADTIDRLLQNPNDGSRLVRAGRERSALFSWSATARGTLEVYARALTAG